MKEENTPTVNYIFYLQTREELENNFYLMSEVLSKINITLLPITAEDLRHLDKNRKNYVIVIRNDLSSAQTFIHLKKNFLDTAMNAGKIAVFDVSSFSEIENAAKFAVKNMYRYFQLPQNLKQVAMSVAVDYFRDRNAIAEWPGGRRAKLPSMEKES